MNVYFLDFTAFIFYLVLSMYSWALFTFWAAILNFWSIFGLTPLSPFNFLILFGFRCGVCGLVAGLEPALEMLPFFDMDFRPGGASEELSLVLFSNRTAGWKKNKKGKKNLPQHMTCVLSTSQYFNLDQGLNQFITLMFYLVV